MRPLSSIRSPLRWLGSLLVPLTIGALMWSCSDDGSTTGDDSPCEAAYKDECGKPCDADGDCAQGLFCSSAGTCSAECVPDGNDCGTGYCDDDGRCQSGAGGAGGSGGALFGGNVNAGGNNGGSGGSCGQIVVDFEPQTPTVVLLIDQSGSMTADFNGQERWDVVYDVLMDPVDGVVKQLEGQVRFSLALYTYVANTPVCPQLIEVTPPALNFHSSIDAVYSQEVPLSNTPTGDSLTAITPALAAFAEEGPKLIMLATDGDPDRCEDPDGHDDISKAEATDAAAAAYALGIETVIIAVGDQVSQAHQQDMANAGKGLPVPAADPCNDPALCAPTFEPTTKQEMIDTFLAIINGQRTCVFALNGEVIPGKECEGDVQVNNVTLPCNDPNGWQLNGTSEIEFVGTACDTILNDPNATIDASFPCDAVSTPPGDPK